MKNVTITTLREQLSSNNITISEVVEQANIYLETNNLKSAYPYLINITESNICSSQTLVATGLAALTLNKKQKAKTLFSRAVKLDPTNYDAVYNSALIEVENQNYKIAFKMLSKLRETSTENSDLCNDLAVLSTNLDNNEDAYSFWKKALEIDPNNSFARNNALAYSLENNLFDDGLTLLKFNKDVSGLTTKTKLELGRWNEIFEEQTCEVAN